MDTGLVTLLRLLEGRPVTHGGADHTSHRLVRRGLTEKRTVLLLVGVSAALGATSLAYLVLDSARVTTAGVLITFALLVQFATVLSGPLEAAGGDDGATAAGGSSLTGTWGIRLRRLSEVVVDGALVTASFYAAYVIVIEGEGAEHQRHVFIVSLPLVLAARYLAFFGFGLYRSVWRYAGAHDAALVAAAVAVSGVAGWGAATVIHHLGDFPASVFVVDALLCTVLVGAARFGERGLIGLIESLRGRGHRRRTVIVGAGPAGRSLQRELREMPGERVIGFVDDDPRLAGRRLQGVPVLGGVGELGAVLERWSPDLVLVTLTDAGDGRLAELAETGAAAGVEVSFVRRELTQVPPLAARASVE